MEVLTKILQQGTEFETLAETALADRYERLVELVTMIGDKGELPIAMALTSVVATPHMVSALPRNVTLLVAYRSVLQSFLVSFPTYLNSLVVSLVESHVYSPSEVNRLHGRVVKGMGHLDNDEAMEAGGREFDPRPEPYSRMSF